MLYAILVGYVVDEVMMIRELKENKNKVCDMILRDLPEWFGIESAIQSYSRDVEDLPMFIYEQDNRIVGFISIKKHFNQSAELYVLGVLKSHHSKGIGKMLFFFVENYCKEIGIKYLQVKTLSPTRESKAYKSTRMFYESVGFVSLEELPTLWNAENPCLLMIKNIL